MIPVFAIRPQPGCDATVAAARALGLEAQGCALFAVEPVAWHAPHPDEVDALVIGSANALRHAGDALVAYIGKPAYAVGQTTARACRKAGLDVISTGSGGLQAVLNTIAPEHRRLLRLGGRERIVLTPPPHAEMTECVVYASNPLPMPPELAQALERPSIVLLHSAEAARHFAAECERHGVDRTRIALVAMGPRVAQAAGDGWALILTAEVPDEQALLAQAFNLCQDPSVAKTG